MENQTAEKLEARGKEFVLPNGKLFVSYATAEVGIALFTAATDLLSKSSISKGTPDSELFVLLNSNEIIRKLVMEECSKSASYNSRKVNSMLFNDPHIGNKACKDYAAIFTAIFAWNFSRFSSGSSA